MIAIAPEQPINYKALSWTIGVHILLFLFLILWKYSLPVMLQPVQEMGMEVNLGTSPNGSGHDQPMDTEDPAEAISVSSRQSAAQAAAAQQEMMRTEDKDAPDVANTRPIPATAHNSNTQDTRNTHHTQQANTTAAVTHQNQRPRYVYNGSTGRGGNGAQANAPGTNEGNTTGNGDRGVPHGTPGATNYTGSPGMGTGGISYSMTDRTIVAFPPKEAEFREGGKVVIRVTVNREGTIINKEVISATSSELRPIALRKLLQVKFNRSEQAPQEQFGNITFVFKTRS